MLGKFLGPLLGLGENPPAYVSFAAVVLAFALIVLHRLVANAFPGKRPPIFEEIPFIGGLVGFLKGPVDLARRGYDSCGEVFTVPVAHKRMTFFVGPAVSPHFYNAHDDLISQKEVYGYSVPTFGDDVVFAVDEKVRAEQFKFLSEALRSSKMQDYVPTFVREAESFFTKWGESGTIDFKDQFNELILFTASSTIMGREVRENVFKEVTHLYEELDKGMQPISVFAPYLPLPLHRARDVARRKIGKLFEDIIKKRRASGAKEKDILQTLIDGKYERVNGGRPLTESEITGLLIASLFAGMHTSTITSAWTGLFMTANKRSYEACAAEQRAIIAKHGAALTVEVLGEMHVLHACITEALRLCPPLIMLLRYARKAFEVTDSHGKTFTIPKGDILATSMMQHKLKEYFKDPLEYDHTRFLEPRCEDKKNKFAFIGFGGGRHGCMGTNFAYLQIKSIWSMILRNFEFELLDPFPELDYSCLIVGPRPCNVKFTRRAL